MRSLICFLLAAGLWVGTSLSVHAQAAVLVHKDPPDFPQGSRISGQLRRSQADDGLPEDDRVHISLIDSTDGEALRVPGIRMEQNTYFILPVPYNLPPGEYRIHAASADDSAVYSQSNPLKSRIIRITEGEFLIEDIPLNEATSSLRQSDDPRRQEESAQLWEVISQRNDDAQFFSGVMQNPLSTYRVTSDFADQRRFIYSDGSTSKSVHWGWDLAAPTGTPVAAPGRGRVVMATERMITGYTVILEHLPGVFSLFYHLDSLNVEKGEVIEVGIEIGSVGSTGVSTGPHLHWEIRMFTVPVRPQSLLNSPLIDTIDHLGQYGEPAE